jgi:hypothetical protein
MLKIAAVANDGQNGGFNGGLSIFSVQVIKVDHEAHGVDTPGDIAKVEAVMRAQHLD